MKSVCIIGLGWLGESIADELSRKGFIVNGTKTTQQHHSKHKVFQWKLGDSFPSEAAASVYIICIGSKLIELHQYEKLFKELISYHPKKIIFISTSSVYEGLLNAIDEESELLLNERNDKHIRVCNTLLELFESSVILRLSGLVGPKRHPAKFLSGRKDVLNPSQKINLVHQHDVIKFIELCISQEINGVFNICSSAHPTRKEFYTKVCEFMLIEPPEFGPDNENIRWISNEKSKKVSDFRYKYDDLLEYYLSSVSKE